MPQDALFTLLHRINKQMRKIADGQLFPLGIGHAEMRILMLIYYYGNSSREEMVARLGVDPSNVSRSLKKLENLKYIQREKDDKDGRVFRIALTEKGKSVRESLFDVRKNIQKTFSQGMSQQDLSNLLELLEKADRNLSGGRGDFS